MTEIVRKAYENKHKKGDRKPKLTIEERLPMTLKYLRQYVTQKELAYEFGVGEATVHDTIVWVENNLIKDGTFLLPRKKILLEDDRIEIVLVDVAKTPVERSQRNKENTIL